MAELIDAVNTLLMARGLAPVNHVVSGHPLHGSATAILERKKRDFCSHRWWFNVETGIQLVPDETTTKVPVPADVIDVDDANYELRGGFLYDLEDNTFLFDEDPDEVTLIYNRDWADLPVPAFNHIEDLAKEEFIRHLGDSLKTQSALNDIRQSYARFQVVDLRHKDVSVNNNPVVAKWKQKMLIR